MSKGENMVADSRAFRIACAAVMEEAKPRALTIEQIRNLAFARLLSVRRATS